MVLLTHQNENDHLSSSEHSCTGLAQVYGPKIMRTWSFKRSQKKLDTIQEQKPEYYFKLVILGDCSTGKTSFVKKFSCDACRTSHVKGPAVCGFRTVEYVDRVVEVLDKHILARLYDTAGQEKFRSLTASYYRGAHGSLVLFDVTKEITFNNLSYWLHDLKEYSSNPDIPTVLVGTKCHVIPEKREVPFERASKYAESLDLPYVEVSAEEGINVVTVIHRLLELVLEKLKKDKTIDYQQPNKVVLNKQQKDKKQWCSC